MVIRPLNIDALANRFSLAQPFRFVMIDDFLDREFAREVAAATPSFQQASQPARVRLTSTRRFAPPLRRLQEALHSPEFLAVLSRITGINNLLVDQRMLGGGLHQTGASGRLDAHVDFNYLPDVKLFRRLNLLLYLNPDWEESWGGQLELWDRDAAVCQHSLAPILGRCVIFEVGSHSFHGTTRVSCPASVSRDSIALYYYSREAPQELNDNVLMPVEAMARRVGYHAKALVQSVKGLLWRPTPTPAAEARTQAAPPQAAPPQATAS